MFQIGQKVIAIAEWRVDHPLWKGTPIHKDEIHVIRDIKRNGESLFFEGIPTCYAVDGSLCAYGAECFAPYNPPRVVYVAVPESIKESVPETSLS